MKDDLAYIEHIKGCLRRIKLFTENISKNDFVKSEIIQDATIRNIEIIGEAAKKVSKDFRITYYEIPWREISGMRDKLIHDYMGVDLEVVWKTIKEDIPFLEELINKIEL